MAEPAHSVLLLGASRGLGLGLAREFLARGWRVIATARGPSQGLSALAEANPAMLRIESLDITDDAGARSLGVTLAGERLTMLFVNAGVVDDKGPAGTATADEFMRLMLTNALGPMKMIEVFAPLVEPEGVIGVMSSGLGSVANNTSGGYDIYRASKAALNTLLRSRAARDRGGHAMVAIAPGWVKTDMGGASASLDVDTSVRGVAEVLISRIGQGDCAYLDYKGNAVAW